MNLGPRTLRAKLTLTTMLVMGALLAVLAVVVDQGARQTLLNSIDQDLSQRADGFAQMRRRPLPPVNVPFLDRGPGGGPGELGRGFGGPGTRSLPGPVQSQPATRIMVPGDDKSLFRPRLVPVEEPSDGGGSVFMGPHDEPLDRAAFLKAKRGVGGYSTVQIDGQPVRIYSQRVLDEGRTVSVMQFAYGLGDTMRSLENLRRILLSVVLPVGVVLAGLASLFLVSRLMRPLRTLTSDAEAIEATNLGERLTVVGQDEFAGLATTLNGMLDRLERAFHYERETSKRLEETVHQQRRFTADASHELKTPLAVIKANTGFMLHMGDTPEEARESMISIDEAADRMTRLVGDLLTLARADAGQLTPRFERVDLRELVRSAVAQVAVGVDAVCISTPSESIIVSASPNDLTRVFVNLVENAARHGRCEAPVRVDMSAEISEITVSVIDEGVGIASEHLPHLFDRFYRIDASRTSETGGTGLGLAITRGIVEAHGGSIEVSSTLGVGTTMRVVLPRESQAVPS